MTKSLDVWVAVTDGERSTFLKYMGAKAIPEVINDDVPENPGKPSRELASDKQGRVFHSADGSRSAMAETTDPQEFEKQRYAKNIANFLDKHQQDYRELVLVSPPKMLGYLRKEISTQVQQKLSLEINKDLTHAPIEDIPGIIQEALKH